MDTDQLKSLKHSDGKTLADKLALLIGTVGENATLKRAIGLKVNNGVYLTGNTLSYIPRKYLGFISIPTKGS